MTLLPPGIMINDYFDKSGGDTKARTLRLFRCEL